MDTINEITPQEVEKAMQDSNNIIIDVREDEEVATGMIEDALHIPLKSLPLEISNLDKEKNYILVCRSGRRSINAALFMEEQGFKVSNMVGGMLDWKGEIIIE